MNRTRLFQTFFCLHRNFLNNVRRNKEQQDEYPDEKSPPPKGTRIRQFGEKSSDNAPSKSGRNYIQMENVFREWGSDEQTKK